MIHNIDIYKKLKNEAFNHIKNLSSSVEKLREELSNFTNSLAVSQEKETLNNEKEVLNEEKETTNDSDIKKLQDLLKTDQNIKVFNLNNKELTKEDKDYLNIISNRYKLINLFINLDQKKLDETPSVIKLGNKLKITEILTSTDIYKKDNITLFNFINFVSSNLNKLIYIYQSINNLKKFRGKEVYYSKNLNSTLLNIVEKWVLNFDGESKNLSNKLKYVVLMLKGRFENLIKYKETLSEINKISEKSQQLKVYNKFKKEFENLILENSIKTPKEEKEINQNLSSFLSQEEEDTPVEEIKVEEDGGENESEKEVVNKPEEDEIKEDDKGEANPVEEDGKGEVNPVEEDGKGEVNPVEENGKGEINSIEEDSNITKEPPKDKEDKGEKEEIKDFIQFPKTLSKVNYINVIPQISTIKELLIKIEDASVDEEDEQLLNIYDKFSEAINILDNFLDKDNKLDKLNLKIKIYKGENTFEEFKNSVIIEDIIYNKKVFNSFNKLIYNLITDLSENKVEIEKIEDGLVKDYYKQNIKVNESELTNKLMVNIILLCSLNLLKYQIKKGVKNDYIGLGPSFMKEEKSQNAQQLDSMKMLKNLRSEAGNQYINSEGDFIFIHKKALINYSKK